MINIDKLRARAMQATPGPWLCHNDTVDAGEHGDQGTVAHILTSAYHHEEWDALDAMYIAEANPAAILALLDELDRLRAVAVCDTCHGTGRICVGNSGLESDGNAPVLEDCPECAYLYDLNAAHLAGYRLAQEQAAKECEETDVEQFTHCQVLHDDGPVTLANAAEAIRALQPPAEWGDDE